MIKYIDLLSAAHACQAQLNRVGRQRRAEPSLEHNQPAQIRNFLKEEVHSVQNKEWFRFGFPLILIIFCHFGSYFFGTPAGSRSISFVLILLVRIFPSDQKHWSRNCLKFADVIFLVLNVDSHEEKHILVCVIQNQGNEHQMSRIS